MPERGRGAYAPGAGLERGGDVMPPPAPFLCVLEEQSTEKPHGFAVLPSFDSWGNGAPLQPCSNMAFLHVKEEWSTTKLSTFPVLCPSVAWKSKRGAGRSRELLENRQPQGWQTGAQPPHPRNAPALYSTFQCLMKKDADSPRSNTGLCGIQPWPTLKGKLKGRQCHPPDSDPVNAGSIKL